MKVYNKTYVPNEVESDIFNKILASEKSEKKLHKRIKNLNRKTGFFLVKSKEDLTAIKKVANELDLEKIVLVNEVEVDSSDVLQEELINIES